MITQSVSLPVSSSAGSVSAEYMVPENAKAIVTLAHGAGAGMHHPFMAVLAGALANAGIATLRFNFPFAENKKKRADVPAVAQKTIEAAIAHAHASYPALPLFAGGKSFGGRMSSQHLALHPNTVVKGIVFYGFPLHRAGEPSVERASHLTSVSVPMLFVQGTRDALATYELMVKVCSALPNATLVKIEGADHSFKPGNHTGALVKTTKEWVEEILNPRSSFK